ncbi:uncharacterized protein LOC116166383 [Photinus pyralis]|uniref:uncharacterized protein LOC116166383 n=1 Tax=Photinus pyralis TaxID=7054 RepID=UPI0012677CE2|nr:uncharacterized protein LOC116166383 [Photinus pyralis]
MALRRSHKILERALLLDKSQEQLNSENRGVVVNVVVPKRNLLQEMIGEDEIFQNILHEVVPDNNVNEVEPICNVIAQGELQQIEDIISEEGAFQDFVVLDDMTFRPVKIDTKNR